MSEGMRKCESVRENGRKNVCDEWEGEKERRETYQGREKKMIARSLITRREESC